MSVETALYPYQLNTDWPTAADMVSEGDDHIRLNKTVMKTTFPNVAGAVLASHLEINALVGLAAPIQEQFDARGKIAGQTWTGAHVFPNTTTIGPLTPTIQGYLATITGNVQAQIDSKSTKTGDNYSGSHNFAGAALTAATQATGTANSTVATTAFVAAAALSTSLPGQTGNAGKFLTTDGANASWQGVPTPDLTPYATKASPTFTGALINNASTRAAMVPVSGSAVDCSLGNYFYATVGGSVTFSFVNAPAGAFYGLVLEVNHASGVISWPASVVWPGNVPPTLSTGRTHLFYLLTRNGGATWRASVLANYAA